MLEGGGNTHWVTRQVMFEALTHMGSDASLLEQHLDGRLASAYSLRTSKRVCLEIISSADESLQNLDTFKFIALYIFPTGGRHAAAVAKLLRLIEKPEKLHTKV